MKQENFKVNEYSYTASEKHTKGLLNEQKFQNLPKNSLKLACETLWFENKIKYLQQ